MDNTDFKIEAQKWAANVIKIANEKSFILMEEMHQSLEDYFALDKTPEQAVELLIQKDWFKKFNHAAMLEGYQFDQGYNLEIDSYFISGLTPEQALKKMIDFDAYPLDVSVIKKPAYKPLHEIQAEYSFLIEQLLEGEGEVTDELSNALMINERELQTKAVAYGLRILEMEGVSNQLETEIKRLTARKKKYDATVEKLKKAISAAMQAFDKEKIVDPKVTLSFRKSESLYIPENFVDELMQVTSLKMELDENKLASFEVDPKNSEVLSWKHNDKFYSIPVPSDSVFEIFKLKPELMKSKAKESIAAGVNITGLSIQKIKSLQIK